VGVKVSVGVNVSVGVGVRVSVEVGVTVMVRVKVDRGVFVQGGVPMTSNFVMIVLVEVEVMGIVARLRSGTTGLKVV
jgi:hypothetical protein